MDSVAAPALAVKRLKRIASMSLAEIGHRGRQQGSKWLDRWRPDAEPRDARAVLRRHAPRLDPRAVVDAVKDTFDRRFFRGTDARATARHDAAYIDEITREADRLLTGRFDLLGHRDLSFGDPIDWHRDPVWHRRSPDTHWSLIDVLDPAVVGDSKIVWELNRHQWMVRLAQASVLTGDDHYAAHALARMCDWIAANPAGRGINWASSLEIAVRLTSWTWVLALLRHTTLLTESIVTTVLASVHAHASHIERFQSHYYSPNTHLTGEALGLFYAGTLYPQFADAERWRDTGAATLIEQADRQITPDGVYFEQSTCYQRYSCDIYLHFLLLAARSGFAVPQHVRERATRLVEFLAAISGPGGSMPDIGDADGGWLMPLCRREADDCRGTLAVAAAVFDRPDFAHDAAPEPMWLTGETAPAAASAPRGSELFADGGYAILRSGDNEMLVDVGPLGCFGHGHADLLSIQYRMSGERCLVDPGTYGYTAEPAWRDYFRGSSAHNTVTVNDQSQASPDGPFGWQSRPAVTIRDWQSASGFDLIDAEHHAYPGVTHRRRVIAVAGGVFVVVDDLLGEGAHAFELTFQFAPMTVTLMADAVACAITPHGRHLWVMPTSSVPLRAEIVSGRTNPIRGWVSSEYGRKTPAPALVYSSRSPLPARVVTVFCPR
jgi:hypothetical protein